VFLVTIGQGDLVWERFGHNAILFRNVETGQEEAYHWGVFDFDDADFIPRLIKGTMLYGMGPANFRPSLALYQQEGRPVWVQRLALTPEQRWELLNRVEKNYLPQNRMYRYDYYRDNCSTRVRDMLDGVLGGRLAERFAADTTAHSYRWHTRRILQEMPPYYLGIQFVLGPHADRPITVWEEMFLPPTLMEAVREVQVPDGGGGVRPLVEDEEVLYDSGRDGPPTSPPFALPLFLLVGLLWAGAFVWAAGGQGPLGLARRFTVTLLGGAWSFGAALGGGVLLGAWLFTDHYFWYANYNLFQTNLLFLALPPAFLFFLATGRFPSWARVLSGVLALAALLGAVLELLPGLGQANGEFLAAALPLNLGLWLGTRRLAQGQRSPAPGREASVQGP
jgi:hypothetical protein